ncbi:hypothetical protein BDF20DRAFT_913253 [Mycotypha africana]|uniref:uncharacterized protein n=1 Tax=Mycotypha africana TaxID=64632 RepID=UPI0023003305|nr:uncharacterized protein BDF20DRAFT_913253 [Mycotypha africana]KAI8979737.1 hypothetical protein BDF20DRAFT_913253 [Mycotypha africana]
MTILGDDSESDSSEEEWVFTSVEQNADQNTDNLDRLISSAERSEATSHTQIHPTRPKQQTYLHSDHHNDDRAIAEIEETNAIHDVDTAAPLRIAQKHVRQQSFARRTSPATQKQPSTPPSPSPPKNLLFQLPQSTPIRISTPVPTSGTNPPLLGPYRPKSSNSIVLNPSSPVFLPAKLSQPVLSSTLPSNRSKSPTLSLQYISDIELKMLCIANNSLLLITRLVSVYKNAEVFSRIREIETQASFIEIRLKNKLHYCKDPCDFILDALEYLSHHAEAKKNMQHKFRKQLCTVLCQAIHMYLNMALDRRLDLKLQPDKKREEDNDGKKKREEKDKKAQIPKEIDLISFEETQPPTQPLEPTIDLISFDDEDDDQEEQSLLNDDDCSDTNLLLFPNDAKQEASADSLPMEHEPSMAAEEKEEHNDTDTDIDVDLEVSDSDEEVITIGQLLGVSDNIIEQISLTRTHQERLLQMTTSLPSPIIVYYALEVFKIPSIASRGCAFEEEGVKLAQTLMQHAFYDEAVATIRKLNLFSHYPPDTTANSFLTGGYGKHLHTLYAGHPELQKQLLSYINKQLRFNFAGRLGIVPEEHFTDLRDGGDTTTPLLRLKERKFQKEIANCGNKVLRDLAIPQEVADKDYYFITLSGKYACLRYILAQRSVQQSEEEDDSISSSENFNGLLDLICQENPVIAKLCIKELVDTGDTVAAPYFASRYDQQDFYCLYNTLPLEKRLLGVVKGEQMSKHKSSFMSRKAPRLQASRYYELPPRIKRVLVNSRETLMLMKDILSVSNVCGLDTEWIPAFASKNGDDKTALMQIASDIDDYVFLLDLKTMYASENVQLLGWTEIILKLLFEDAEILKLAFDFTGDFSKLHNSIPSSTHWSVTSMMDLKNLKTMKGESIIGGLNGVVYSFLDANLSKKQQLSNWEQRPLSEAQCIYAAIDAVCILDVFSVLCQLNHPFIRHLPENFTKAIPEPSFPPLNRPSNHPLYK